MLYLESTLYWIRKSVSQIIDERVRQRKRPVNGSWRMDKTYIKLNGKWVYLYRAVDRHGDTVDFLQKSFKFYPLPEKVTIDKSGSNKVARFPKLRP
jgi:putative transposase